MALSSYDHLNVGVRIINIVNMVNIDFLACLKSEMQDIIILCVLQSVEKTGK